MSRTFTLGLTALALAACQPVAEPAPPAEPVAPVAPAQAIPADEASAHTTWTALEDRYLHVNVRPSDPVDALEWTEVRCGFLSSEFGGDNSAQDRAINARMDELRCGDDMVADARALRQARAEEPAAVVRLDALLARNAN